MMGHAVILQCILTEFAFQMVALSYGGKTGMHFSKWLTVVLLSMINNRSTMFNISSSLASYRDKVCDSVYSH